MTSLRKIAAGASAAVLVWTLSAGVAAAQTVPAANPAGSTDVNDIVVTARRSTERLQDVPLAITATTSAQLTERGITDLNALARYTPSFSFKDYVTAFHGNPVIRGMVQQNTIDPVTNVGVFVDGVYLQRDYQLSQSLGDFERIEVVKGPQSALYGANTFAGAINYVTRRPTDDFTANAELTAGNAGERRVQAAVGFPILKGLLDGRIYVGKDDYDGTIRNQAPSAVGSSKHFSNHERSAYSGALRFTPSDTLTFDVSYDHTKKSEGIRPYYTIAAGSSEQTGNCGPLLATTGRPSLFCGTYSTNPDIYRTGVGNAPHGLFTNNQPQILAQNTIFRIGAEWQINDKLTAHYIFGHTHGQASEAESYFANTYNPMLVGNPTKSFSQQIEGAEIRYNSHELRLNYDGGPLQLEGGFFHSTAADRYIFGIVAIPITGNVLPPLIRQSDAPLYTPPGLIFFNNVDERFQVNSGFGRVSYSFLDDRATIAGELRYGQTKLHYTNLLSTQPSLDAKFSDPVPRVTAQFKLTPQNLLYASAAEGIKTGGFNGYVNGTVTLLASERSYAEEKNWTYEIGSKNTFFDQTLTLNIDAFYIDWPKKLAQVAPANAPILANGQLATSTSIYLVAANATNYGLEVEGQWRPIRPISIDFAGTVQHARFGSGSFNTTFVGYCGTACANDGNISHNKLERQSAFSATAGINYRDHFRGDWDLFGGVDMTYQSSQYVDQMNLSKIAPYALVNGRVGFASSTYKVFVWAKNLANKLYVDNSFYLPSGRLYTASFGERRTFGVTVTGIF